MRCLRAGLCHGWGQREERRRRQRDMATDTRCLQAPPNNGAAHDAVARARRGVNTPARFSSTGARLLRTVSSISGLGVRRGVEPTLADLALGVDVALPNTGGAGRVVMWYSHRRREAMAELRLM